LPVRFSDGVQLEVPPHALAEKLVPRPAGNQ